MHDSTHFRGMHALSFLGLTVGKRLKMSVVNSFNKRLSHIINTMALLLPYAVVPSCQPEMEEIFNCGRCVDGVTITGRSRAGTPRKASSTAELDMHKCAIDLSCCALQYLATAPPTSTHMHRYRFTTDIHLESDCCLRFSLR